MEELLDSAVDFRALTPNKFWEAHDARATIDEVLKQWLDDEDRTEVVTSVEGAAGDRRHVSYRLRREGPNGPELVEQQAYYEVEDGRISWIRILCTGFWLG